MADGETVAYSVASFICALFVLEFGADKFIDHTAVVARRTGIPQGVIALLTAGAEWEELAVVVICIARHRSSLAMGNIVGSVISNILGAFSLGLLFHSNSDEKIFDKSSKIYSALLLVLTTLISGLVAFGNRIMWRAVGGFAIALFAIYVISIAWTIYKGLMSAPEMSDSDSSDNDDDDDDDDDDDVSQEENARAEISAVNTQPDQNGPSEEELNSDLTIESAPITETAPLLRNPRPSSSLVRLDTHTHDGSKDHSLPYHVAVLTIGFISVILSAYVLSHAASTLVTEFGISDIVFGVVILSIATTIPEKFIAVVSGFRGEMGIMVANTVGSNIFLLSLCIGILWVATDGKFDQGSVKPAEIGVMLGSTIVMTLTVWFGAKWARFIGGIMLGAYTAFLVLEFTIIHKV